MANRISTDYIVIHSSATRASWDGGVDQIRKWHLERGFTDVGYHFVIRRDGAVEIGRPVGAVGAHCAGRNSCSVGICMIGGVMADGTTPEANFSDEQWFSLARLVTRMHTKYPQAGIMGHREMPRQTTQCPSFDVSVWWNSIRRLVEECLYV
jgi:N-acetyl-anhydromuramyl-L-alanine amidase AmpD